MSATTTAARPPSDDEIRGAIEAADHYWPQNGMAPHAMLSDAIGEWALNIINNGLWQRWPCGDDDCPGRPEYDKGLDVAYTEMKSGLLAEVEELIGERFLTVMQTFRAAYPDAPRAAQQEAA